MKKLLLTIIVFAFVSVAFQTQAAMLSVRPNISSVAPGKNFAVDIVLNTNGELINTVSGTVQFSSDSFDLGDIRDGNSQINFWVEAPHKTTDSSGGMTNISFAGITPGGLFGRDLHLFTFILTAKKTGSQQVNVANFLALKNDGKGTAALVKSDSATVSVLPGSNAVPLGVDITDTEWPESFVPAIGSDPALFSGRYFVAFAAQDKGSGIDHYEVKEGFFGSYEPATSPHELKDQTLKSRLYVKAVDKKGNIRVATLSATGGLPVYLIVIFLVILLLVCTFAFKILRAVFRR